MVVISLILALMLNQIVKRALVLPADCLYSIRNQRSSDFLCLEMDVHEKWRRDQRHFKIFGIAPQPFFK